MLKTGIALSLLLGTLSGFSSVDVKARFCADNNIQSKLSQRKNNIAFKNQGGLLNGGVCWWHSRLVRNAAYLAYFSPDKPRPHKEVIERRLRFPNYRRVHQSMDLPAPGSVKYILEKIKKGQEVVEIPGFSNFNAFTSEYSREVLEILEAWQIEDGAIDQDWIVGLRGSSEISSDELASRMHDLYAQVQAGDVVYQKLQIAGITAHAWLVIGMVRGRNGFDLQVLDSNYSSPQIYEYRFGDTSLFHNYYGNFVPYTGEVREEERLKRVRSRFCK